ncbi:MAG: response regulator [Alphaproteobacteria bacterium]|nr:response regulator [Alphaproteobacteria bacterium]
MAKRAESTARDAIRPLQVLLAAAIATPILLFAGAAWLSYRATLAAAHERISRLVDVAAQQAQTVFQTDAFAADRIADHTATMTWEQIAQSPELNQFLKLIKASLPQASVVRLVAPDGRIAATDVQFPPPDRVAEPRPDLRIHRPGMNNLLISSVERGTLSGVLEFTVARPMPDHGSPGGLIEIVMNPGYFTKFYAALAEEHDSSTSLVRDDGVLLARDPPANEPVRFAADSPLMQAIRGDPVFGSYRVGSAANGTERLFAYERVGDFPIYVVAGVDRAAIVGAWARTMGNHLIYGIPVTLSLIAATVIALRRTRQAAAEVERRAELEEQYRQAQKMEAIGQLTGGVAHDFNNLLTVILGSLERLQQQIVAEPARRLIQAAMRGAERGARLTQSLLSFARRQSLRPETVNINRVIKEFGELLRGAAGDRVQIQFLLNPTVDPCRVDPAQFQTALLNLVVNARDAMPEGGGRVSIETDTVVLDASSEADVAAGRYVRVAVNDTGCGMAPEVLERAFEPFYTTKEVGKGSGLGLSQVYGFVKQSGGHIELSSEFGIGTTVRLYLPRADDVPKDHVETVERAAASKAETVLVVEDDAELRKMVAENLRSLGYRVLTAADAAAALALVEREPRVDLLFSDYSMPRGMLGDELARRVRRLKPGLKVLLTSGYAVAQQSSGVADFGLLQKPYRQDELARAIRQTLDRS